MKQYDLDSPTSCSLLCPPWSRVCWGQHLCVLCFLHVWCVVSTPSRNWIHLHRGQFVQNRCLRGAATQSKPSLMYPACLSFRQHRLASIEMESEEWEALVSGCMLSPPRRFSCDSPSSWNGCWCRWQTRSSQPCGNILPPEPHGSHPLSWSTENLITPEKGNLRVTAVTQKLQGFSFCKGQLTLFIGGKDKVAILDEKRRELANYVVQVNLTPTFWDQNHYLFLIYETHLPFTRAANESMSAQYKMFMFSKLACSKDHWVSVNTRRT